MASDKFDVVRTRSRKWQNEVMSIRHSGRDCPAACQFVFKCASQSTPVTVPRHVLDVWENTTSNDAEERPEWQNPTPVYSSVLEQWKFKSPYRAQYEGPNFWTSHGDKRGRYGFSQGKRGRGEREERGERGEMRAPTSGLSEAAATRRSQQSEGSGVTTESAPSGVNRSHASGFDSARPDSQSVFTSQEDEVHERKMHEDA